LHQHGEADAHAEQRERQDDQRREHRAGGTHHAEQHEGHAEQHEAPYADCVDVLGDGDRIGLARQEEADDVGVDEIEQHDQAAGQQHIDPDAGPGALLDAIPFARANALRGHG